ncbi:MAG: DUF4352 domain-containing protein [Bryobacteraceae bacterium]
MALLFIASGCGGTRSTRIDYQMGERVPLEPFTYNVIETTWRSQLGSTFQLRLPTKRFLVVYVSITNGGGKELAIPSFQLETATGDPIPEEMKGDGVEQWLGLIRTIGPAQTLQGRLLFDCSLGSYKLRVSNGGEPGTEKFAFVEIPLRLDPETPIAPAPSQN